MKKLLAALLIGASPLPATSAIIHYTFANASFTDGATLTGGFDYNTVLNTFGAYDFTTTAGMLGGFNYTNADSTQYNAGSGYLVAAANSIPYLLLNFSTSLASAGSHLIATNNSYECSNCYPYRYLASGEVDSTAAVPEPAMLGLFGLGALSLGLSRRRRAA